MNLSQMKYALVVAKESSMTRAAEKLFMSQPNLSRAIKELEDDLGIRIFRRTPKGIFPTAKGEEFLGCAQRILEQVESLETQYKGGKSEAQRFSISVPRASYIACAFTEFTKKLDPGRTIELVYKETNSLRAVENILNDGYDLGIIRYRTRYEPEFREMLDDKGLVGELVCEFSFQLIMSASHPLAAKTVIEPDDLCPYTEIAHADPYVPSLPMSSVRQNELSANVARRIFVFERGSQMQLLSQTPGAFMWVSPVPRSLLSLYGLVQRECAGETRRCKDVMIRKKSYVLSDTDRLFIDELTRAKRGMESEAD